MQRFERLSQCRGRAELECVVREPRKRLSWTNVHPKAARATPSRCHS